MASTNDIINRLTAGTSAPRLSSTVDQLAGASLGDGVKGLNTELEQLRVLFQAQTASTKENTEALTRATNTQSSSSVASTAANVAKSATSFFSGGLISPLLSGVLKLFGRGGSPEPPPPLPAFSLPRSVTIDGSIQDGGSSSITSTQYAADGLPRVATPSPARQPQVTVQVQAMDARSFLDRSDDIARAVKEAMLNSHSVNDVIGEL